MIVNSQQNRFLRWILRWIRHCITPTGVVAVRSATAHTMILSQESACSNAPKTTHAIASSLRVMRRLACLLPDRLNRRDDKTGSIQVYIVPTVLRNAVLTVSRKRCQILL